MLSNNPTGNKFRLSLPTTLFIPSITEKYNRYINLKNTYFKSIDQMVNESIMRVEIPGLQQEVMSQTTVATSSTGINSSGPELDVTYYAGTKPLEEVQESNEITLTIRHTDAYMIYFFLLETFYHLYRRDSSKISRFTIPVTCLTNEEVPAFNAVFDKCLYKSISGLNLGYDMITKDFKEFQIVFVYSDFSVDFDLPQGTVKTYRN